MSRAGAARAAFLLLAIAVLQGCVHQARDDAALPPSRLGMAWLLHQERIAEIGPFLITGRVASSELDLRADLRWQELNDRVFELRLAGPFGAGAVELRGDPDLVEVRTSDGVQQTTNPEEWIYRRFGWTLPINGLRYWALGIPNPDLPATPVLDDQGRLAGLEQSGWQLVYSEYREQGSYDLPRRFEASNGKIKLKLIIDRWEFPPPL